LPERGLLGWPDHDTYAFGGLAVRLVGHRCD
jgi:hypothetical protein